MDEERWNKKRAAIVGRGVADGLTYTQIQAQLNSTLVGDEEPFSRSAVCGKVKRLGLSKRLTTRRPCRAKPRQPKPEKPAVAKKQKAQACPDKHADYRAALARVAKMDAERDPSTLVQMDDLKPHHCRQFYGDPKFSPLGWCGKQRLPGLPYCKAHAAVNVPGAPVVQRLSHQRELEVA